MATAAELETRIKQITDWTGLRTLWGKIRAGDTPDWSDGDALEYLVIRAFELDTNEQVVVRYPYEVQLFDEKVEEIDWTSPRLTDTELRV